MIDTTNRSNERLRTPIFADGVTDDVDRWRSGPILQTGLERRVHVCDVFVAETSATATLPWFLGVRATDLNNLTAGVVFTTLHFLGNLRKGLISSSSTLQVLHSWVGSWPRPQTLDYSWKSFLGPNTPYYYKNLLITEKNLYNFGSISLLMYHAYDHEILQKWSFGIGLPKESR